MKPKPCPFCGGEARVAKFMGVVWVECGECKCSTKLHDSEDLAIKTWNKREEKP